MMPASSGRASRNAAPPGCRFHCGGLAGADRSKPCAPRSSPARPRSTDGFNPVLYRYERLGPDAITGWTHGDGAPVVDTVAGRWEAQDGSQYTEVESGYAGEFSQTLSTVAGQQYVFSFYVAANPTFGAGADDTLRVLWDGGEIDLIDLIDTTVGDLAWNLRTYLVTATGSSTVIGFQDAVAGAVFSGAYIDNVSVVAASAVPVPGSLALLGLGAPALGLGRRRRARPR